MATTKKFRVKHGLDASNNTISFVNDPVSANDAATKNYVDIQVASAPGDVSNTYLTSTFTTNTDFQSYVANTNSRIDTLEAGGTLVTNSYLTSTFTTNTDFQSFVANTNSYIATVEGDLNTQEAKQASDLANTNSYIATKTDDSTVLATNTALRTLIDDRMQVANVISYVDTEVAALVNSAPTTLDTLNELASALGDDANFATTVTTNLGQKLGATASVTLTGDVTGTGSFSANALSLTTTDTNLANTNAYIASVSDAQSQYLQVANVASNTSTSSATFTSGNSTITFTRADSSVFDVDLSTFATANTSTSSATYTVANATLTFTRADSSTFDVVIDSASVEVSNTAPSGANEGDMWWDNATGELYIYYSSNWVEAVAQDVTPYANNGTFSSSNNTITFVRTDGSQFDVVLTGVGEVTNTYVTSTYVTNTDFQSTLANTNAYIATKTDDTTVLATNTALRTLIDDRMQVANVISYVDTEVAALVNSAPVTLNTLNELADALGDDPNFATTVTTNLGQKLGSTASVTLTGDVTGTASFSANALSLATTDTNLANTNAYIATKTDDSTVLATNTALRTLISDRVQVANLNTTLADYWPSANVINYTAKYLEVANVESSSISVSNTAPSGAEEGNLWWDNSTGELYVYYSNNWVEAVAQDVTPYANNGTFSSSNNTITFVRTDGSQFDVVLTGVGEVTNSYVTSTFTTNTVFQSALANTNAYIASVSDAQSQYLQVANSTTFLEQSDVNQYLQVANSTTFLEQSDVDQYLQVANVSSYGFATESYVDTSVAALVNAAPTTLNTLDELASALGDDANFATTTTSLIGTKASNTYVNTLLANTNAYIATKANTSMLSAYLEVANVESSSSVTVSNTAPSITANGDLWWDNSDGELYIAYDGNWVEAVAQDVTPYTNNASYTSGNSTLTFVRTDGSQYEVALDLSSFGGGDVSNTYLQTQLSQYLEVANVSSELSDYWPSANVINYTAKHLEVANADVKYLHVDGSSFESQSIIGNVIFSNTSATNINVDNNLTFGNNTTLSWNSAEGTLDLAYDSVALQIGQEQHFYGKATENINNGDVVMFAGVQGDHVLFAKADQNSVGFIPEYVMGVATQNILNNEFGYVTSFGKVREVDTRDYGAGALLYLSGNTAGALSNTSPVYPAHSILVAASLNSTVNGTILVRVSHRDDLDELHNVDTSGKANNDVLFWNASTNKWQASDAYATKTYVDTSVASLVNSAPTTLNTLDELASALGDDANFATSVTTTLGTKASNTYVNTLLANTNAYIASVSDAQSQYLEVANSTSFITADALSPYLEVANSTNFLVQADVDQYLQVANVSVYIPANTSTTSATLSGNTATFTRADSSTFELDLSGIAGGSGGSGGAAVTVSNTAPSSPAEGDLWYDSVDVELMVYYDGFWVPSYSVESLQKSLNDLTDVDVVSKEDEYVLFWNSTDQEWQAGAFTTNTVFQAYSANTNERFDRYLEVANVNFAVQSDIDTAIANLVSSAPSTLDTLNELASALGDDENFATTVSTNIGQKLGATATVTLSGDVSGSASFSANAVTVTTTVSDDFASNTYVQRYQEVANASYITANTMVIKNPDNYHEYVVTVASKTSAHPYNGVGSGNGYFLDGVESPSIILAPNQTYRFDQSDASNSGHPLVFYTTPTGGSYTTGVTSSGTAGSASAYTEIVVDEDTPQVLYYMCSVHSNMGSVASVLSDTAPQYLQVANSTSFITSTALSPYLEVANVTQYIPANTSTTSAVLSGNTATFTRADSSTFDLDLSGLSTGGGGGGASVTVDSTPPVSPSEGDLYFDEDLGTLFIYYDSQFVEVQPSVATTPLTYNIDSFTANGSVTQFGHTGDLVDENAMIVTVDGVVQRPTTDYTVSGNTVTFGTAPSDTSTIAIRIVSGAYTGDGITYAEATTNTTATAGNKYIVDTTSSAITITLPASATLGDEVGVMDGTGNANTNNITIDRNGHKIQGLEENLIVDTTRGALTLVYYNTTQGWLLTEV